MTNKTLLLSSIIPKIGSIHIHLDYVNRIGSCEGCIYDYGSLGVYLDSFESDRSMDIKLRGT